MIISCIGDSLTEGDYGVFGKRCIANVKEKSYPYFLKKELDCEVRNFGKCGYRASHSLAYYKSGEVDVKDSDFIVICLGTNGGIDPMNFDAPENKAYLEIIELCKKDAPDARILLCTPPHATENPEYSNCGYAKQIKDAVDFVRTLCAKNGYLMLDLYARPEFSAQTEYIMQPNDGLHFSEIGYLVLAHIVADAIRELNQ